MPRGKGRGGGLSSYKIDTRFETNTNVSFRSVLDSISHALVGSTLKCLHVKLNLIRRVL